MRKHKIFSYLSLFATLLALATSSCGKKPQPSSSIDLFTVTWKNYDGTILEIDHQIPRGDIPTYDGKAPEKPNDDKYSYIWSGWTPDITPVVQDQTYTAIYSSTKIQYEITYNLNGGENNPSNPTSYTFEDNIVFKDATKKGYTFTGWVDDNGHRVTSIDSGHTGPIVLNALWNEGNEYTITLDSNGGILSQNQFVIQYDHEYSLPFPTQLGYTFIGWYDGEIKIENQGIWHIAQDISLIAKWALEDYSIFYHLDGGMNHSNNPSTYNVESESFQLEDPSKVGYSFKGWFDESFTNQITSIEKGTRGEINLYAKWEIITYSIQYELNGGGLEQSNPSSYTVEDEISLNTPTKDGYEFIGWDDGNNIILCIEKGTTGNLTLSAKWQAYKHGLNVITENMERGSVIVSGSGYTDERIVITAVPKEGYLFDGWYENGFDHRLSKEEVYSFIMPNKDLFISARFLTKEESDEKFARKYGTKPILSNDEKTLKYGLYPQSNVTDPTLINSLNELTNAEPNGWYLYDDDYYAKVEASPHSNKIVFENGDSVISGETYWFKCELIEWKVLSNYSGIVQLVSSVLLDAHSFYNSYNNRNIDGHLIYPCNYEYSDIRSFLNNEFYSSAFALNHSHIQTVEIDNSQEAGGLSKANYICNNTTDNVYLLSYQEYTNSNFGFPSDKGSTSTRYCKTTDYARARGIYYYPDSVFTFQYCGSYWTRSPIDSSQYYSQVVNVNGQIVTSDIISTSCGVRPGITLKIY